MGNPFDYVCAIAYFSIMECLMLKSKFKHNAKLMFIFVDHMLIVLERVHNQTREYTDFKLFVNKASHLKLEFQDL